MSQSSVRHIDDLGQGKLIPGVHQQPEVSQHDTENLSLIYENKQKMKIKQKQKQRKNNILSINIQEFPVKLISRF